MSRVIVVGGGAINVNATPSSAVNLSVTKESKDISHNTLLERDLSDQHPISAITGLSVALNSIPDTPDDVGVLTMSNLDIFEILKL